MKIVEHTDSQPNARVSYPCDKLLPRLKKIYRDDEWNEDVFRTIIDKLFFASLGKEEGEPTRLRIIYCEDGLDRLGKIIDDNPFLGTNFPRPVWEVISLDQRKGVTEFNVENLRKIAPAANLPGCAIVVGRRNDRLAIIGLARRIDYGDGDVDFKGYFTFTVPQSGHIAIHDRNGMKVCYYEDGRLVALKKRLELRDALFTDGSIYCAIQAMCPNIIGELPKRKWLASSKDNSHRISEVVFDLVKRMAQMKHGGMIVMCPHEEGDTKKAKYRVAEQQRAVLREATRLFALARASEFDMTFEQGISVGPPTGDDRESLAIERDELSTATRRLKSLTEVVGQLTAVDNAVVIGPNLDVICAGYEIKGRRPKEIRYAESIHGQSGRPFPLQRRGSRHSAAAKFAYKHPGGLVFIRSQDGPLHCLHRPTEDNEVVLVWRFWPPET